MKNGRPVFAIALDANGTGTGSARSIPGVDIGHAIRRAVADGPAHQGRRPRHGGRRHHRALAVDRWQDAERVQLRICDLAPVGGIPANPLAP